MRLPSIFKIAPFVLPAALCLPQPVASQIAPGVMQPAARTANITGTVTQSNGATISGADVRLSGPSIFSTKTDAHGIFTFTAVPYGTYQIVVTSSLGIASRRVSVVGDINVAVQYAAPTALRTIAHVSTSSAGAHINVTAASIYSVAPSDYAFQGNSSWKDLLNEVPGVTVGGNLLAGSSLEGVIPGSPFQPIVLSINGTLPYETSVTLDGMPITNTAFFGFGQAGAGTDLSYLPMPMFATADIVRGPGADAPSIVDSIGGSLVLHAPGPVYTNAFEFSITNDPYGGVFSNTRAALHLGRLSVAMFYGLNDSPGPLPGLKVVASAGQPLTVNGQAFSGCPGAYGCAGQVQNVGPYQNCFCLYEASLLQGGVPANTGWAQHSGAIGLSYEIAPTVTAQVFYAGSSSKGYDSSTLFPTDFRPGAGYSGSIAPGSYNLIQTSAPASISQAGALVEERLNANIGQGVLRLAALQNNSFTTESTPCIICSGEYTLYGTGYYASAPSTPVNFNGMPAFLTFPRVIYGNATRVNNRDLFASYAVQVNQYWNAGASYVSSYYNNAGSISIAEPPYFAFTYLLPADASETTRELRIFAGGDISDKFSLMLSWYFTHGYYHVPNPATFSFFAPPSSWVDSSFPYNTPRIAAVWRANQDIVLRGSAGGGYALPQILDLEGTSSAPICSGSYCEEFLTNLSLVPETSFGLDLGTDIRLRRDTVLSLDLYDINLHDQFFSSTNLTPCGSVCGGKPLYVTEVSNIAHSRFKGINFSVSHEVPRGIYWHGALGLTRGYVVSVPAGFYNTATCTYCTNTYIVPGINYDGAFQSTVPYANASATVGYRWSPGRYVDLSPTYYGNNNAYYEPAFIDLDAHAGYLLTRGISLLVTFRNITGVHDQSILLYSPSLGAPTVGGQLLDPLIGIPFGPRAVLVTLNYKT